MSAVEASELIRNYAIVVGGIIGLALAVWRGVAADRQSRASAEQARIGRRTHITEVFNDAVAQLGDDKLEVRLGAVYTFERICEDFRDFGRAVFDLLQTYVRERSVATEQEESPADIQEIVKFLRGSLL